MPVSIEEWEAGAADVSDTLETDVLKFFENSSFVGYNVKEILWEIRPYYKSQRAREEYVYEYFQLVKKLTQILNNMAASEALERKFIVLKGFAEPVPHYRNATQKR